MSKPPLTAVLLAAGRGQRLRPYTDYLPKPLLTINGRPMLDYVLAAAREAGIRRVCLVTNYLEEKIHRYVGDGAGWDMTVAYCHQVRLLGTADALQTAVEACPDWFEQDRPFVLTATDYALPPVYLVELVADHLRHGADVTVGLKKMLREAIIGRSNVQLDRDGRVTGIIEKPSQDEITSPYVASLSYVLSHTALGFLPSMIPSARGEYEIQSVINAMIAQGLLVRGLLLATPLEWESINSRIECS